MTRPAGINGLNLTDFGISRDNALVYNSENMCYN